MKICVCVHQFWLAVCESLLVQVPRELRVEAAKREREGLMRVGSQQRRQTPAVCDGSENLRVRGLPLGPPFPLYIAL